MLWISEFFYVSYLQLNSMSLREWAHDISQKVRDHLIKKSPERVGGAPSLVQLTICIVKLEMHLFHNIK